MEWQGEYEASSESQQYLFMYLPLAIVLMITVLSALFNDIKKPLIIVFSLPLAIIGTAMEQAKENLETSREQYNNGMERLVELLEARAQWQESQSDHIDAQANVKLMQTKYLKATGQLLAD